MALTGKHVGSGMRGMDRKRERVMSFYFALLSQADNISEREYREWPSLWVTWGTFPVVTH